jgi:hypothetical protein
MAGAWYSEDCRRVLTTSKGQVAAAPIVPARPPAEKCSQNEGGAFCGVFVSMFAGCIYIVLYNRK